MRGRKEVVLACRGFGPILGMKEEKRKGAGDMDIRSIRCFCLAYEWGSIGKAAQHAYFTRQGMSQVLRNLEAEVKQPLFVRGPQGLTPTDLAHSIYPKAVELIKSHDEIQSLCFPQEASREPVRLCVASGVLFSIPVDAFVQDFAEACPDIALMIDTVEPPLARRCVEEGAEDIALVSVAIPHSEALQGISLCEVPLYAAVHESLLPLGTARGLCSFEGLRWFGVSEAFPTDALVAELARERGVRLDLSFEQHDYQLILEQVRQRKGACAIPAHYVHQFCQDGIVAVDLGTPRFSWEIQALVRKEETSSSSVRAVVEHLREFCARL